VVFFAFVNLSAHAQNQNSKFKLLGEDKRTIEIEKDFDSSKEFNPFEDRFNKIYGLAIDAEIEFASNKSQVRFVLIDENFVEHLVYEAYPLLSGSVNVNIQESCEETALLNGIKPYRLQIEVIDAKVNLHKLTYASRSDIADIKKAQAEVRSGQNADKITRLNENLKNQGQNWVAGPTAVSEMSYSERKKLYGQSTFPAGFEFYVGGVISAGATSTSTNLKSATASSPYIDAWDWRDRHGKNWISPVTNQEYCGSCWAFSSVGATEAITNLYFNQLINLDLSEQDLISCSNAGGCDGGYPYYAVNYITKAGIVDEATFPYSATDEPCENKSSNPNEFIKISGFEELGWSDKYAHTEDALKSMLIEMGPLSSAVVDWSHSMVLVGYKVVKEGDLFFYRDLNLNRYWKTVEAGDPLIGKTVWIYKNSWGDFFGDKGYVYIESSIDNIQATFGFKTPVISTINKYDVVCEDRDGDGYYWWGLGPKPANCPPCPDLADGDDSDPTKGPLDEYGYCMPLGPVSEPVADFSASALTIDEGEAITFNDASSNNPTSWSWTFEGGTPATSTAQHPKVTFATPGSYSVSLTARNSGGSDTETKTGFITVNRIKTPPVADFIADVTSLKEGGTVAFTDQSTNTPSSWSWTFEGGTPNNSSDQNPSIIYNTPGTYSVSLTATNADGLDTEEKTGYITVNALVPPMANFTANTTSVTVGNNIQFNDLSTFNPEEWFWEFPGGTPATSSDQHPNVAYNSTGTYDVTLTVTNADGHNSVTMTGYITVNPEEQQVTVTPPVANFLISSNSIETGQSVSFTDQSSNSPTSWLWTFENGDPATSTEQNPTVTYNAAGSFAVTLVATNDGGSDTKSMEQLITVSVPVPAPVADFTSDKTNITEGEAVSFTDKSSNNPSSWKWDFEGGNPSTSTERNPKVSYNNANSYKVTLTVTNAGGNNTKVIENYIQVQKAQPEYCIPSPFANEEWIASVTIGTNTKTSEAEGYADFTSTVFSLESGTLHNVELVPEFISRSKFEYWAIWIDYDQDMVFETDEKVFSASKSKSTVSGSISIPADLALTTRMRVAMGKADPTACDYSDMGEIEDYTVKIVKPTPKPPVADFAANVYAISVGGNVNFSDISANDPTSWSWTFEGGEPATSTKQNPSVAYSRAGKYNVTLTVANNEGSDTKSLTGIITVLEQGEATYCIPENLNSDKNYIDQIFIGSALDISSADGYSLSTETVDLIPGLDYDVTLVPSLEGVRNFWRIWIDFNNDGDFDDADETILAANNNKGDVVSSISIPSYASGETRMRISMKTGKTPSACDDNFEGEVEDYKISFGGASSGDKMASSANPFEDEPDNFLTVYPNPTTGGVQLRISVIGNNDSYAVYNSLGSKIMESTISAPLSLIDLSEQPSGMFIVVINSQSQSYIEKIIKN